MEIKDAVEIIIALVTLVSIYFKLDNKVDVLKSRFEGHLVNHKALEERVEKHETKIDEMLEKMNDKMDLHYKDMTEQLGEIKISLGKLSK